jgi:glutathione S-transferase
MCESTASMLFLAEKYGPTPLLPKANDARLGSVLELTVFGEASIGTPLNPLLAAHFAAPEADKRNWSVRGQESRVEKSIAYISERLGDRKYLVGDDLTLADISVCCAIAMWKGALGKDIPENVAAYMTALRERPAYQRATKANA